MESEYPTFSSARHAVFNGFDRVMIGRQLAMLRRLKKVVDFPASTNPESDDEVLHKLRQNSQLTNLFSRMPGFSRYLPNYKERTATRLFIPTLHSALTYHNAQMFGQFRKSGVKQLELATCSRGIPSSLLRAVHTLYGFDRLKIGLQLAMLWRLKNW